MAMLGSAGETLSEAIFARADAALAKVGQASGVFYASAATLIASLLLGGGTHGSFLSDAVLELLAIPTFLLVASSLIKLPWASTNIWYRARWPLTLCFAIVLLPLCQLVPLPPWIWTKLPGREAVAATFALLDGHQPWMPMSVSPALTWLSVISLLAPVTIFLGTIQLGGRGRRNLSLIIIVLGVVGAFLGLVQIAQGPASGLRFFAITNETDAVGFFANRNHLAALLYTVLIFAAAWAIDISFKPGVLTDIRSLGGGKIVSVTAIVIILIVVIVAEAMTRSRAGLGFTMIAVMGIFGLAAADRRNSFGAAPNKLLLGVIAVAVLLAVQFALYRLLDRFAVDPLADARIPFGRNTIEAALIFMPFGAGVGTFVPVYGMFEKTGDTFANIFANHAHDDFLEVWLETGVVGLVLLASFAVWALRRAVAVWQSHGAGVNDVDRLLSRSATIAIGLLLGHSVVDYPLRTGAMAAVFAFACALLVEPLGGSEDNGTVEAGPRRHGIARDAADGSAGTALSVSSRSLPPASADPARATEISPRPIAQAGGHWGEDIDWPAEWRKPDGQEATGDGNAPAESSARQSTPDDPDRP